MQAKAELAQVPDGVEKNQQLKVNLNVQSMSSS